MKGLRTTSAKFLVFALVSVLSFVLIYNTMQDQVDGELKEYEAVFSDVSGLRAGDNVRVAGVQVGKVTGIEVMGRQARVNFTLQETQPLLESTRVVMRYQNLLGQRYLSLQQGPKRGAEVPDGGTVPITRTDPGFDLTELLNGFRPLFEVLDPEDVNQLAQTIVQVLQGEGGTIESLLTQTTRLTNFLADRDEVFDQVLDNLTPVLRNLDGQGDAIDTTVDELKALMDGLAREKETIGASIEQMSRLINQTSDFFVDVRVPAVQLLRSLRNTAGMFATNLDALRASITGFDQVVGALGRVTSYQSAGNVYICQVQLKVGAVTLDVPPGNGPYSEVCGG